MRTFLEKISTEKNGIPCRGSNGVAKAAGGQIAIVGGHCVVDGIGNGWFGTAGNGWFGIDIGIDG